MTRLSTLLILLVLAYRAGTQVAPINEVVADTLRQTIDIYLTNRPFAGSDPREGVFKLFCVPCKLVVMITRLSTQNVPGIAPLLTGVCTFILGDQQTCTDQIGFIALALEFADNTQACERFWACAKAPEPDDAKKKKDEKTKTPKRLHPSRPQMDLPDDSIVLTLPDHLNNTDAVSTEIYRQIHSPQGVIGTTKRPNFVRSSLESVSSLAGNLAGGLAGGMFNTFSKFVGMGGSSKPFNDPHYSRHNPYNARDAPDELGNPRPGFGANVGFGVFTSPFIDFLGKKKR